MATANTKLTVDTSQAVQAIQGLNAAWVNASAKMNVAEKVLNTLSGAFGKINGAIRDQAQFFSAATDAMQVASVQMAMAATDGMIKPMTLAKGANVLMRGDLKLTNEQMTALAKASVELGRATGEDVNQVFDRLSKSVLKGSTEAMTEYGIQVSNTGTIQERQARILQEISTRYGSITIAAQDAAEAQDAAANKSQMQLIMLAKQMDGVSQTLTRFKNFYITEFVPGIIDSLAGTELAASKMPLKMIKELESQWESIAKSYNINAEALDLEKQKHAQLKAQGASYAELMIQRDKIDKLDKSLLEKSKALMEVTSAIRTIGHENNIVLTAGAQINALQYDQRELQEKLERNIGYHLENQARTASWLADIFNNDVAPAIKNIADMIPVSFDLKGWLAAGKPKPEPKGRSSAMSVEQEKYDAEEVIRRARMERRIEEFARDKELADNALRDKQAADLKYELDKSAEQDRIMKDREAARVENVKNAELEIKEAKDKAAAEDKARLESIKAKTIEVSGVVLGAIFAEKKARDGLSKSEYVMKQLAAYMKGQALRYAAEAIGHGAQALAASVLAPATAPALWAASAADAAAAAAFGLGAAAAGKMSGKPSGGSKSESSSKGPQRETLTGTSVQRSEITVILGGRGVVIGNADELARQIGTIMGDAQRRGVVRA